MTAGKVQSDQERLFEVELLTVSQVAKWARVSPKSIYRWGSGLGISDNGSNIRETFLALPIFERECRIFSEKREFFWVFTSFVLFAQFALRIITST